MLKHLFLFILFSFNFNSQAQITLFENEESDSSIYFTPVNDTMGYISFLDPNNLNSSIFVPNNSGMYYEDFYNSKIWSYLVCTYQQKGDSLIIHETYEKVYFNKTVECRANSDTPEGKLSISFKGIQTVSNDPMYSGDSIYIQLNKRIYPTTFNDHAYTVFNIDKPDDKINVLRIFSSETPYNIDISTTISFEDEYNEIIIAVEKLSPEVHSIDYQLWLDDTIANTIVYKGHKYDLSLHFINWFDHWNKNKN